MDARLDLYRGVSDAELLSAHGLFVAEGRLVVRRVIQDGRYKVHSVLMNDAARRDLADVLARLPATVPVLVAPTSDFRELTGYNIHRGCLALVERPAACEPDDILVRGGPVLMLEGVANADNVGGIFRNAAAFGAAGVIADRKTCDPLYRKAVRTSMGAVLRVPYAHAQDWSQILSRLKAAGYHVAALTPHAGSMSIDELAANVDGRRLALVLGAEGAGLSAGTLAHADALVTIPMTDEVDSLNVSVAAGVALYAVRVALKTPRAPADVPRDPFDSEREPRADLDPSRRSR